MRRSFDRFCDQLGSAGARVEWVEAPGLKPDPALVAVVAAEAAGVHSAWFNDPDKRYGLDLQERLRAAMEVTVAEYIEATRLRAAVRQAAGEAFRRHDLLLTPAVGHARKRIGEDLIDIDGEPHFYREVLNGYSALVNLIGCPAIVLPAAHDATPHPSVQLLAPWWGEDVLLDTGRRLEQAGLVETGLPAAVTA